MSKHNRPSKYQAAIIEWIRRGRGDAIVEAVAGSGKTTTLEMAYSTVKRIQPEATAIFLAFNRSVAGELKRRLPSLETRTLHSLGNRATSQAVRNGGELRQRKYAKLAERYLLLHATGKDRTNMFLANDLARLSSLVRMSLGDTNDLSTIHEMCTWHNIDGGFGRVERYLDIVPLICADGIEMARQGVIDFTDQLWLPNLWNLPLPQYDWIFIDESQDLNIAQLELIKRSRKRGGRLLFVGDPAQAIYGFAGADSEALGKIEWDLEAHKLPLSVTYRCAHSHVSAAQQIVPHLEARADAPYGVFEEIQIADAVETMRPGDMVLSREVAPVVAVQRHLEARYQRAFVDDIERFKEIMRLLVKFANDGIRANRLEDHLLGVIGRANSGGFQGDSGRMDIIRALLIVIAERPGGYSDYRRQVARVFDPRDNAVRCLTIHKAKGLEAERVFLIRPDLLPHRCAEQPWQVEQEENLLYVALTRATRELWVCHGELPEYVALRGGRQSRLQVGGGRWGTGFVTLRGQVDRQPNGAELMRASTNLQPQPSSVSRLRRSQRPHFFHQGYCVNCNRSQASMGPRAEPCE